MKKFLLMTNDIAEVKNLSDSTVAAVEAVAGLSKGLECFRLDV